jgi:hypothetical protein
MVDLLCMLLSVLQMFRSQVVTSEFMQNLGQLMVHVKSIESRETNIEAVSGTNC